jgi:hypothetical protein
MDAIGWFIATTHQMIGHDRTAAIIGQPPAPPGMTPQINCLLCQYESDPTPERRAAVEAAIGGAR